MSKASNPSPSAASLKDRAVPDRLSGCWKPRVYNDEPDRTNAARRGRVPRDQNMAV